MGGNGSYCESSLMSCGKMGTTLREKPKNPLVGLGGGWGGGGDVLSNIPEEKWEEMGDRGGQWQKMGNSMGKFSHNAYSFTSFQCPWALLALFFVWPTKCTPLRVCVMCPSRSSRIPSRTEPRTMIGARVCKTFATLVDN